MEESLEEGRTAGLPAAITPAPAQRYRAPPWLAPSGADVQALSSRHLRGVAAHIRQLALQRDLLGMRVVAEESVGGLLPCDRVRCLFHDSEAASLWMEGASSAQEEEHDSTRGLAGQAVRTGQQIVTVAAQDHAYVREVDDPWGIGSERLLAQPVRAPTGEVHAVVVVVRSGRDDPFSSAERQLIALWAEHAAPLFHLHHLESIASDPSPGVADLVFRRRALQAHREGSGAQGEPLLGPPLWTYKAHRLVAAAALALFAFVAFVQISEYGRGPAVVVAAGQTDVTAKERGVLATIRVAPGDVVRRGQVLAELDAADERADVEKARDSLDQAQGARLRDPSDEALEQNVAALAAELARAQERLDQRLVVAPVSGRVVAIRSSEGQALAPGEVVATLATDGGHPKLRAFIPGRHRPEIAVGQELVLEVDGYEHASRLLTVASVGEDVLGPSEVRRMVGPQVADVLDISGPTVVVEADLGGGTLRAGHEIWTLHDGMTGHAEVELGEQRIVFALFPDLEGLLSYD